MPFQIFKFDAGSNYASKAIQELAICKQVRIRTRVTPNARYFQISTYDGSLTWFTNHRRYYDDSLLDEITFNEAWEILNAI